MGNYLKLLYLLYVEKPWEQRQVPETTDTPHFECD